MRLTKLVWEYAVIFLLISFPAYATCTGKNLDNFIKYYSLAIENQSKGNEELEIIYLKKALEYCYRPVASAHRFYLLTKKALEEEDLNKAYTYLHLAKEKVQKIQDRKMVRDFITEISVLEGKLRNKVVRAFLDKNTNTRSLTDSILRAIWRKKKENGVITETHIDSIIEFEFDSTKFTPDGETAAQKLLELIHGLRERGIKVIAKDIKSITLVGYTDTTGSAAYNMRLSIRRAEAVKNFLKRHGIEENIIHTLGKGETSPVCSSGYPEKRENGEYFCTGEEDFSRSRRVEVIIKWE